MSPSASWQVSACLHRVSWLLHAHVVEAKLRDLQRAVKANFNPNQPRVPAGNPDGGEWTDAGGRPRIGSGGGRTRVAQNVSRTGRGSGQVRLRGGQLVEATPGQEAELAAVQARADRLLGQVRELDPKWHRTPSFTATIEGEIEAARAEAIEAEARLQELSRIGIGPGPYARESLPARGASRDFRIDERREINRIGSATGCHTCGRTEPGTKTGNFVPDHQPPTSLNFSGKLQRLYPQCRTCSEIQGGWAKQLKRRDE
jgi:hypothetical protein